MVTPTPDAMKISDWITAASTIATSVGVLVAIFATRYTLHQNIRIKRSDWMFQTTMELHRSVRLYELFDEIQYIDIHSMRTYPLKRMILIAPKKKS